MASAPSDSASTPALLTQYAHHAVDWRTVTRTMAFACGETQSAACVCGKTSLRAFENTHTHTFTRRSPSTTFMQNVDFVECTPVRGFFFLVRLVTFIDWKTNSFAKRFAFDFSKKKKFATFLIDFGFQSTTSTKPFFFLRRNRQNVL